MKYVTTREAALACIADMVKAGHYDEGKTLAEQFLIAERVITKMLHDIQKSENDHLRFHGCPSCGREQDHVGGTQETPFCPDAFHVFGMREGGCQCGKPH